MKAVKTNVMRILEKERVPFHASEYPHGKEAVDGVTVASLLGQDVEKVFKTLVTTNGKQGYFVFVIPVAKELDLKKAAKAVGEKAVEMLHVKEINKVTGYIRGGCSPIGMKKQYQTVFHISAKEQDVIAVSAGKIGYQIETAPDHLIKITQAKYADVCKEQ
ncbi:MAG: Cys-tRNA(Pro) deacylase [Lachnospiraceae bacterium]|nr:Cys-tRNA(Pro) deacylase [Lachnospiraceae bacterium]